MSGLDPDRPWLVHASDGSTYVQCRACDLLLDVADDCSLREAQLTAEIHRVGSCTSPTDGAASWAAQVNAADLHVTTGPTLRSRRWGAWRPSGGGAQCAQWAAVAVTLAGYAVAGLWWWLRE